MKLKWKKNKHFWSFKVFSNDPFYLRFHHDLAFSSLLQYQNKTLNKLELKSYDVLVSNWVSLNKSSVIYLLLFSFLFRSKIRRLFPPTVLAHQPICAKTRPMNAPFLNWVWMDHLSDSFLVFMWAFCSNEVPFACLFMSESGQYHFENPLTNPVPQDQFNVRNCPKRAP